MITNHDSNRGIYYWMCGCTDAGSTGRLAGWMKCSGSKALRTVGPIDELKALNLFTVLIKAARGLPTVGLFVDRRRPIKVMIFCFGIRNSDTLDLGEASVLAFQNFLFQPKKKIRLNTL